MAERLRKTHQEDVRKKIQATQLINRLQSHIFDNVEMSRTQVSAALGLLKKTIPDLSATQLSGEDGGPIKMQNVEVAIIDPRE